MMQPTIHDNEIHGYRMLLPEQTLILETSFQNEKTDILFQSVLAYSFESAGEQNILFEVVQSSIENFIRWYAENRDTQKSFEYGFPIKGIDNPDKLLLFLQSEQYHYYEINASVGLDGFVIAKNLTLKSQQG